MALFFPGGTNLLGIIVEVLSLIKNSLAAPSFLPDHCHLLDVRFDVEQKALTWSTELKVTCFPVVTACP